MQEDGEQIGRFKVLGLMWELALVSNQPGSHAYKQATVERPDIPSILNREFEVPAPNQVWCGDIIYIWAQGKWHYLAVVLDLYARRVVGWALSSKPDADLVIKALDMAYGRRARPQGLLFHSDQGLQFTSADYKRFLTCNTLICSMSTVGHCGDNAACESFFGQRKRERVAHQSYRACDEARADLFDYIERFHKPRMRRRVVRQDLTFSALFKPSVEMW